MKHIKKVTQRDRYGNQVSYEFESPMKPVDVTRLMEKQMEEGVPQLQVPPMPYDHPGEPRGTDTIPAWLTPGEFVVNKEAMSDPQNAATVQAINSEGRAMQARKGGGVPPMPMDAEYYAWGDWVGNWFGRQDPRTIAEGIPNVMDKGLQAYDMVSPFLISSTSGRGYDAAMQDAYDIEDPNADLSGDWVPPVVEDTGQYDAGDAALMENYEMIPPYAEPDPANDVLPNEVPPVDIWEQRAVESLTQERGLLGALIPPSDIEIEQEKDRLIRAAATAGERGIELDAEATQAEADAAKAAIENVDLADANAYDNAVANAIAAQETADKAAAAQDIVAEATEITDQQQVEVDRQNRIDDLEQAAADTTNEARKAEIGEEIERLEGGGDLPEEVKQEQSEEKADNVLTRLSDVSANDPEDDGTTPITGGNEAEALAAGQGAPNSAKSDALNTVKGIFGDLLDTKELKRMAILYAGSRLMGYSHGGSLQWAAKGYLSRIDSKASDRASFIKTNAKNFTPESLEAYRQSGSLSDLKTPGTGYTNQGEFKTFFGPNGKQVQAQKQKGTDGSYRWVTNDGRVVHSGFSEDASRVKGTPEYTKRVQDESKTYSSIVEEFNKLPENRLNVGKDDKASTSKLKITAAAEGPKIARWAIDNNIPPELMGDITQMAYADALRHRQSEIERGNTGDVSSLTPFLNEAFVKTKVGNPQLFKNSEGETISIARLNPILSDAREILKRGNPAAFDSMSDAALNSAVVNAMREEWAALGIEGQKPYNDGANDDENGFVKFMDSELMKAMTEIAKQ